VPKKQPRERSHIERVSNPETTRQSVGAEYSSSPGRGDDKFTRHEAVQVAAWLYERSRLRSSGGKRTPCHLHQRAHGPIGEEEGSVKGIRGRSRSLREIETRYGGHGVIWNP